MNTEQLMEALSNPKAAKDTLAKLTTLQEDTANRERRTMARMEKAQKLEAALAKKEAMLDQYDIALKGREDRVQDREDAVKRAQKEAKALRDEAAEMVAAAERQKTENEKWAARLAEMAVKNTDMENRMVEARDALAKALG